MTSTTFFSGSNPSTSTARRSAPATPLVNKNRVIFAATRASAGPVAAYPWMTQALRARMSPRALRLLRADY